MTLTGARWIDFAHFVTSAFQPSNIAASVSGTSFTSSAAGAAAERLGGRILVWRLERRRSGWEAEAVDALPGTGASTRRLLLTCRFSACTGATTGAAGEGGGVERAFLLGMASCPPRLCCCDGTNLFTGVTFEALSEVFRLAAFCIATSFETQACTSSREYPVHLRQA